MDYQKIPEVLPGRAGEIVEQMSEEQLVQMATGDPGKDQGNALGSAGISVPGSAAETPLVAAEGTHGMWQVSHWLTDLQACV